MRVGLDNVRNRDLQDKHYYLIELKVRNMKLLTLGKFNERSMEFEYFNYYTNSREIIDLYETKKLVGIFNIENILRDIEYSRFFGH